MRFFAWLKDVLRNDDIVSALSGTEVEPPFLDRERKRRTQIWTVVGYFAFAVGFLVLSTLMAPPPPEERWDPPGLVFVMEPGPGGGGGGGDGTDEPLSELEIAGEDIAEVAVNVEVPEEELVFDDPDKPDEPEEEEEEEEPEEEDEPPEIVAPVVAQAPDAADALGALDGADNVAANAGPGTGGGIGEGEGAGIGPGTGGGFGGGAYRLGSGIDPPRALKTVQPTYTNDALAKKVEGEVILEVIILAEGKIGPVRILHGLGAGLNEKAIECVRQWRFVPGKFKGQPVDVVAEIAVEFSIL
jgi:protein TonB